MANIKSVSYSSSRASSSSRRIAALKSLAERVMLELERHADLRIVMSNGFSRK